ncbi:asparaginyl-tRNA synthetase [Anaerobacterium chartisolvens]|uniref:Asparaginyl-tRNA synthetase n=1 Tax=Anaerobacterium chartisolvens TaxID=1297424 RepID=A0A369BHI1_9FIRM|nr:asparagine synthetase A [Anaerobacterium chartisolvens]RCX21019.1 asparaginyl-tRNA synthetase [Anaerobacterium chartisolvens]
MCAILQKEKIYDDTIKKIRPPKSWKNIENHYQNVINNPWYQKLVEVENLITVNTVKFYENKNIKTLHLPITTGSISSPIGLGSDSSPVKVNLCNVDTYLADSMQFMLEYGCRLFKNGCYYIMPSFRGESADERHLCQFYHSEAEIPGTLENVINLVEEYLKYLCSALLEEYADELKKVAGDTDHIEKLANLSTKINRVTLDEAIKLLDNNPEYVETHEAGFRLLNKYGEQALMSKFDGIVWLTHFDTLSVPFYQAVDSRNSGKALNADLLFGIGEVVGSGERHQNSDEVLRALKLHNVDSSEYEWYFNMKEKYPMKTSGFGLGVERFILWLFKHNDIRDCQIIPRFNGVNIVP